MGDFLVRVKVTSPKIGYKNDLDLKGTFKVKENHVGQVVNEFLS